MKIFIMMDLFMLIWYYRCLYFSLYTIGQNYKWLTFDQKYMLVLWNGGSKCQTAGGTPGCSNTESIFYINKF
jgi:hypothetical protein